MTGPVKKKKGLLNVLSLDVAAVLPNRCHTVSSARRVIMGLCVHISCVLSLCELGKRNVWSMLGLLLFKPPDEEAFQSDYRTQMLRLARRNHTQSKWRLGGIHPHWAAVRMNF